MRTVVRCAVLFLLGPSCNSELSPTPRARGGRKGYGRQRATWRLGLLTCYDGDAINTNTKLTLLVFIVFFLALALAALWML